MERHGIAHGLTTAGSFASVASPFLRQRYGGGWYRWDTTYRRCKYDS